MSVAILYSPCYGGGWSSEHSGSDEERLFLLTYPGFIEALDRQRLHNEAEDQFAYRRPRTPADYERKDPIEMVEASLAAEAAMRDFAPDFADMYDADFFRRLQYELVLAVPKFLSDWKEKFPGRDYLPLSGLDELKIGAVSDLSTLHIECHDGAERIGYRRGIWE